MFLTDHFTRVRRVAPDGTVTTLAGGLDPEARLDGPCGLVCDAHGNVLVVENAGRIRRITPGGLITTLAGSGRKGSKDGPLLDATLDEPTGIAIAPNGDLFVLEPERPRVRKISNGLVTTIYQGLP